MLINSEEITNIRPKPWWMYILPGIGGYSCCAIYPNFYVPRFVYDDLMSASPSFRFQSICIHELEHLKRAERTGVAKYYLLYIFSRKFRFEEEIACRMREYEFYLENDESFDFEKQAQDMAKWVYLGMCSYKRALTVLRLESQKLHK